MPESISALIRTKNCEDIIDNAIQSVYNVVDKIIVVDDFSRDSTFERCVKWSKRGKVNVFLHHWQAETEQILFGINHINENWVLLIDSDEKLSSELQKEIPNLFFSKYHAFRVPFKIFYLGRRLKYSLGWDRSTCVRLFRKDKVSFPAVSVHSWVDVDGQVGYTNGYIVHNRCRNLSAWFRTITHYARWQSVDLRQSNKRVSLLFKAVPRFFKVFFKTYESGRKDGLVGVLFSLEWALNSLLTYLCAGIRT